MSAIGNPIRNRCAVAAGLLLIAACQRQRLPNPTVQPPPTSPPLSAPVAIRNFAELVNQYRQTIGCKPLLWDERVAIVAQTHSEEMARHGFYSHIDLKGQNAFARLNEANVPYIAAAENLAYGQQTAERVLTAWLNSAGHRKNIDNCKYTHHGVGLLSTRWTHVFVQKTEGSGIRDQGSGERTEKNSTY